MKKRAFTLIELLVVVGIVSLLASVLMPSLRRAKELARVAVCSANIRQLVLANTGYANENEEYFVLAAEDAIAPLHRATSRLRHVPGAGPQLASCRGLVICHSRLAAR